ncbi:hypothetical protein EVAR_29057_1 [Eumeta japonica]|uniref:Uncharacterized protein n=1 Tax=Eumeta variegata TaxID=151549 RepID=A0A4C1VNA1_EUMVA|nr:hypothetical protein EVAR_29057_1 [Eumeta japonica]
MTDCERGSHFRRLRDISGVKSSVIDTPLTRVTSKWPADVLHPFDVVRHPVGRAIAVSRRKEAFIVFSAALQFSTVVVGGYNGTSNCSVLSFTDGGVLEANFSEITPNTPLRPGEPSWANYIKGVLVNFPVLAPGPTGSSMRRGFFMSLKVLIDILQISGISPSPLQ